MNWSKVGLMSATIAVFTAFVMGLCWVIAQIAVWLDDAAGQWARRLFLMLAGMLVIIGLCILVEWSAI